MVAIINMINKLVSDQSFTAIRMQSIELTLRIFKWYSAFACYQEYVACLQATNDFMWRGYVISCEAVVVYLETINITSVTAMQGD